MATLDSKTQVPEQAPPVDDILGKDIASIDSAQTRQSNQDPESKAKRTASFFNVIFSGFALLSDGYQSGIISFINLLMTQIYGKEIFNETMSSRLSYSLFVGAIVGQLGEQNLPLFSLYFFKTSHGLTMPFLGFGLIIDRLGRKIGLILTTVLVILGAAMSAASSGTTPEGLLWMMVISRGVMVTTRKIGSVSAWFLTAILNA